MANLVAPSFIPEKDWGIVLEYASKYGISPYLLAAIGWHETHWGREGWGRYGYYLGVGCYSPTNANPRFKGLANQLQWAASHLSDFMGGNVTQDNLIQFARRIWRPGNPDAWAKSVWKIYQNLKATYEKKEEQKQRPPKDYVPVRQYLENQGYTVGWNNETKKVTANGVDLNIKDLVNINGTTYALPENIEQALYDAGLKKQASGGFWDAITNLVGDLLKKAIEPFTSRLSDLENAVSSFTNPDNFKKRVQAVLVELFTSQVDFWIGLALKMLDEYYNNHKKEL